MGVGVGNGDVEGDRGSWVVAVVGEEGGNLSCGMRRIVVGELGERKYSDSKKCPDVFSFCKESR